jgi:hypothetical protein
MDRFGEDVVDVLLYVLSNIYVCISEKEFRDISYLPFPPSGEGKEIHRILHDTMI